jgi:hypothetical protein
LKQRTEMVLCCRWSQSENYNTSEKMKNMQKVA